MGADDDVINQIWVPQNVGINQGEDVISNMKFSYSDVAWTSFDKTLDETHVPKLETS